MLLFGYVAHDEAADPAAPLDASAIVVSWGTSAFSWVYTVSYSRLGETPPANAKNPLKERLRGN